MMISSEIQRLPRQRGVASIMVVVFLIAGVVFILAQMLGIIGTRSVDNAQDLNSTAALMLAESGLQRAQAILGNTDAADMTAAECIAAGSGTFTLTNAGSFSYGTATAAPLGCGAGGCNSCTIQVTGTVGSTARNLSQTYVMGTPANGVAGRGTTVKMVLRNNFDEPAVALFNMAWRRQDKGPSTSSQVTVCGGTSTCTLRWNLESSSGLPSVGGIGTTVVIGSRTVSMQVVQSISQSRDYVEVGTIFPSINTTNYPVVRDSYWDDDPGNSGKTVGNSNSDNGWTNSGVAATGPACNVPANPPGNKTKQACSRWCENADTLIFGFAGRVNTNAPGNELSTATPVTFNGLPMIRNVHFPELDGSTPNASGAVYSEIWWRYNQDYNSGVVTPLGLGATSYGAQLSATAGARFDTLSIASGSSTMTVTSIASALQSKICIGDLLSRNGGSPDFVAGTTVIGTPENPNNVVGGLPCSRTVNAQYKLDRSQNAMTNPGVLDVTATSTKLVVTPQLTGSIQPGVPFYRTTNLSTVVFTSTTPTAVVSLADPNVVSLTTQPASQPLSLLTYVQGTSTATIQLPPGTPAPPLVGTIVRVLSGAGAFPANTAVTGTTSTSFTVSQAPSTGNALVGAVVGGGIYSLFANPTNSNASNKQIFDMVKTNGTTQWASGFVCLSGVDPTKIRTVTSTKFRTGRWQEIVSP